MFHYNIETFCKYQETFLYYSETFLEVNNIEPKKPHEEKI